MSIQSTISILNKKASYEFSFLDKYVAGLLLTGTEIKSLRLGKANITDGFCVFQSGELIARNIQINEYDKGTHYNHEPKRDRKLLLNKHELKKLEGAFRVLGYDREGNGDILPRVLRTFHALFKRSGLMPHEAQMFRGLTRRIMEKDFPKRPAD